MMESNRSHRVDPELVEIVSQPRQGSDPHLPGNADLSPWEHEVRPAAARAGSGRGKIVAAVIATGVFLGTGFAIGAPVYAISRWWANRPVATATLETRSPVEAQAAGAPPANEASLPSAAARSALLVDEEVMFGAPPVEADSVEAPEEAVAIPDPPVATLTSEPPAAGPLRSEAPIVAAPPVDPVTIERAAVDPVTMEPVLGDPATVARAAVNPVTVERVTIAPLAVERVTIDQVAVDRVVVAPVAIDRVTVDPAQINVPRVDGEQVPAR